MDITAPARLGVEMQTTQSLDEVDADLICQVAQRLRDGSIGRKEAAIRLAYHAYWMDHAAVVSAVSIWSDVSTR